MSVQSNYPTLNPNIYIAATRMPFASASTLPVIITATYIYKMHKVNFSLINTILAILGVLFLHLAANCLNDFFDWDESDLKNTNSSPFNGGSRYFLNNYKFNKVTFLYLAMGLFTSALITSIFLVFNNRILVLFFGFLGAIIGILYSTEPFSFQKKSIGEILIFLAFGPILTLGTGYAISGNVSFEYALLGIPAGFATTAIILVNEIPDYEADLQTNKQNLVVKFGKNSTIKLLMLIFTMFFLSIGFLIYKNILPLQSMIILLLLPMIIHIINIVKKHINEPKELIIAQKNTILFQVLSSVLIIITLI